MRWSCVVSIAVVLAAGLPAEAQRMPPMRPTMPEPVRPIPTRPDLEEVVRRQASLRADIAAEAESAAVREAQRQEREVIRQTYERDLEGRWFRRGGVP